MIAFLGMGLLGSNFVKALRKRGIEVNVWNRTSSKAKALEAFGAKAFDTVVDCVKGAERIHLTLSDDDSVNHVLAMASEGFSPNVIIVDHTTTTARGAKERSLYWQKKNIHYIHAPVFMGPQSALEATGMMMVSGDQNIIQTITPELESMTGTLKNLGSAPDKAAALKLIGNHFLISLTASISDSFALAKALDFPEEEVGAVFDIFNLGSSIQARTKRIRSRDYAHPTWELAMARKDARLMQEEAELSGIHLPLISAVGKQMDQFIADGHGDDDWLLFTKHSLR